jgi:hypothetical protein
VVSISGQHEWVTVRLGIFTPLVAAVLIVASGCSAGGRTPGRVLPASTATAAPYGEVVGTLGVYGGAFRSIDGGRSGCGCELAAGTVRLIGASGRRIDLVVGKSGRFRARVPDGRYTVKAGLRPPFDWPIGSCDGLLGPDVHFDRSSDAFYFEVDVGEQLRVGVGCMGE